jgi:hypothetical protein
VRIECLNELTNRLGQLDQQPAGGPEIRSDQIDHQ